MALTNTHTQTEPYFYIDRKVHLFVLFKISAGAGLAAPAGHDHDCAASDHRDGVHPLQHRQGSLQPLRGLPGECSSSFSLHFNKTSLNKTI